MCCLSFRIVDLFGHRLLDVKRRVVSNTLLSNCFSPFSASLFTPGKCTKVSKFFTVLYVYDTIAEKAELAVSPFMHDHQLL